MAKYMWFGNSERMQWVPCPAIDMANGPENWVSQSQYLSGGAAVRRSATGARVYEMEWNLTSEENLDLIEQYYAGVWGEAPFYFIDPSAMRANVFPAIWAQPRVALKDSVPLIFDAYPSRVAGASVLNGPNIGVQYNVTADSIPLQLTIPIPDGYQFHFQCAQSVTATAFVGYSQDGAASARATEQTLIAATGGSLVTFAIEGTGATEIYWMRGEIVPNTEVVLPFNKFISGKGNSGCDFTVFDRHAYSAALDKVGASAVLTEIGSWL